MKSQNKAFFFDRDGIVNVLLPNAYVRDFSEFRFTPEFFKIFIKVLNAGYYTFVITNQQGIGKGLMSEADLELIHKQMNEQIIKECGKTFDEIYFCPDLHSSNSFRRKPNPGMLLEAIEQYTIDPHASYFIGDSISDIEAAKKVTVNSILIGDTNYHAADYQYHNLLQFLDNIHLFI
ncbi:MAG TPA: HAD-IIIA family hydrolase [Candidatus Kapabacteria bacterium]|nr:HAD-IIIA family hydrolase [Candidatus Kapabacteria bacterium]